MRKNDNIQDKNISVHKLLTLFTAAVTILEYKQRLRGGLWTNWECGLESITTGHDEVFLEFKCTARRLLAQYHALAYEQKKKEKTEILRKLFGGMGTNVSVGVPFYL